MPKYLEAGGNLYKVTLWRPIVEVTMYDKIFHIINF